MKPKVLVIGYKGNIGSEIFKLLKKKNVKILGISRKEIDVINNFSKLKKQISIFNPNFVINCIVYNGINQCNHNPSKAHNTNYLFPKKLVSFLKTKNINFIHFSTEAVFKGNKYNKGYYETSKPKPTTIYGATKYKADKYVIKYEKSLILRLPVLYGNNKSSQLIPKLTYQLRKNKKIYTSTDVYSTPVYVPNLVNFIVKLISKDKFGYIIKNYGNLIHFTSKEYISIYNFMKKISVKLKKSKLVIPVKDKFFDKKSIKPKFLGLRSKYGFFDTKNI